MSRNSKISDDLRVRALPAPPSDRGEMRAFGLLLVALGICVGVIGYLLLIEIPRLTQPLNGVLG